MWPLASEYTLSYATRQCIGMLLIFIPGHVTLSCLGVVPVVYASNVIPRKNISKHDFKYDPFSTDFVSWKWSFHWKSLTFSSLKIHFVLKQLTNFREITSLLKTRSTNIMRIELTVSAYMAYYYMLKMTPNSLNSWWVVKRTLFLIFKCSWFVINQIL